MGHCRDCNDKDQFIQMLQEELQVFRQQASVSSWQYLVTDGALQPGYQLLVDGSSVAIRAEWLHTHLVMFITTNKRKRSQLHHWRRIVDRVFEPYELARTGGTKEFCDNVIFIAHRRYAAVVLKIDHHSFNRVCNEKMAVARMIMKCLQQH